MERGKGKNIPEERPHVNDLMPKRNGYLSRNGSAAEWGRGEERALTGRRPPRIF